MRKIGTVVAGVLIWVMAACGGDAEPRGEAVLVDSASAVAQVPAPPPEPAGGPQAPNTTGAAEDSSSAAQRSGAQPPDAPAARGTDGATRADVEPVPQPADAAGQDPASILRRTSSTYENIRSLRADFTMRVENRLLRSSTTSRGTLYQRRPDRILLDFADPEGDVIVSDGSHFWIYYPSVDAKQVIRAPAGQAGAGGVDLQAQFLGDPVERFDYTLHGKESVGGREAWVFTLDPRAPGAGYQSLKVWIDTQDSLVRRFELDEGNGNLRAFEFRDIERNPRLGDELFRFQPPEGARVIDRG